MVHGFIVTESSHSNSFTVQLCEAMATCYLISVLGKIWDCTYLTISHYMPRLQYLLTYIIWITCIPQSNSCPQNFLFIQPFLSSGNIPRVRTLIFHLPCCHFQVTTKQILSSKQKQQNQSLSILQWCPHTSIVSTGNEYTQGTITFNNSSWNNVFF